MLADPDRGIERHGEGYRPEGSRAGAQGESPQASGAVSARCGGHVVLMTQHACARSSSQETAQVQGGLSAKLGSSGCPVCPLGKDYTATYVLIT